MQAQIISVGTELTLGQVVDTNAAWLSQRLAEIGITASAHITVPDDLPAIRQAIQHASQQAELLLITGGLGPTDDDRTRHALAEAMNVPLELHRPSAQQIREFFAHRQRSMPQPNIIQAMLPRGAEPLANALGTAPGICGRVGRAEFFALPGVPHEMQLMFQRQVLPRLARRSPDRVVLTETLLCCGAGESSIASQLADLMQPGCQPTVGTAAHHGIVSVRITATGQPDQARQSIQQTIDQLRQRLGQLVFGQGQQSLAQAVAQLLTARATTIATAESCTGGLLAKHLTDVPGSSNYFLGSVVAYSNAAKTALLGVPAELIAHHGAVSAAVAEAMARNCRSRFSANLAIGITGIAGPTGGTDQKPVGLVYIALAEANQSCVAEHRFGPHQPRDIIRMRAVTTALNMLRLHLLQSTHQHSQPAAQT